MILFLRFKEKLEILIHDKNKQSIDYKIITICFTTEKH